MARSERGGEKGVLQIAVCDDERAAADLIAGLARDWARGRGVEARVDTFASADALTFSLDDGAPDVALLDIEMPGASGMELARLLRERGERTQVVFVTGIIDHVFDGYDVDAVSYLLKPVRAEKLFAALDRAGAPGARRARARGGVRGRDEPRRSLARLLRGGLGPRRARAPGGRDVPAQQGGARARGGRALGSQQPVREVPPLLPGEPRPRAAHHPARRGDGRRRAPGRVVAALTVAPLAPAFVLAMRRRGTLSRRDVVLLACVMAALGTLAAFGSYALVTGGYARLRRGFESSAERFQQEVLSRQYDEIRAIYLDMRGWRHDYHNHLRVMKAELAAGQLAELSAYLDELEADLDRVDTYVKSSNLMVDAILNSKLSLAERDGVAVTCKARVPDALTADDVDLCVILGNLLDNAIEACAALPADGRWLRVYVAARGSQLYASIQNSAVEDPSFNQRNYISEKRGNHGLGMKRVAAVVEKYEGFLNLANEPGVFAAEASLPL